MKSILLTGATGFLGSRLLDAFISNKYNVVIITRDGSDLRRIDGLIDKCKSYNINECNLKTIFEENSIETVVHTACNYGRNNESINEIIKSNLLLGLEILDISTKFNVSSFINTDTFLEKKINNYSLSKKQFTEWLDFYSNLIQVVNIKIEHFYGKNDDDIKLVQWILSQLQGNAKEINLTKGEQERDFIYIDDVVSAYISIVKNLSIMDRYNEFELGTGEPITVKLFIKKLKKLYELKNGRCDTRLNFGALPYRDGECMKIKLDNKSLLKLGWEPQVNFEQGLNKVLNAKG